ncbi:MEKHLA domain-containing protein [Pseudomonas sp. TE3610]
MLGPDLASRLLEIDEAYFRHTGKHLPMAIPGAPLDLLWVHEEAPYGLLAHDGSDMPRFVYANRQAQRCFDYPLEDFIGMVSELSSPPEQRASRQYYLDRVRRAGYSFNYQGERYSRSGQTFQIYDGEIWELSPPGAPARAGQASLFWLTEVEIKAAKYRHSGG